MPSQVDRKGARLDARMAARLFDDPDVRAALDELDITTLVDTLGAPEQTTTYARQPGWTEGMGRPALADDDPAVMQAIGRCASNRLVGRLPVSLAGSIHSGECGFCEYPLPMLLEACSWAVWQSGYIVSDLLVWTNDSHQTYVRSAGRTGYQNPRWSSFYALPLAERAALIQAATGRAA